MSYKSQLNDNNTDLQSILDTINALPEAGEGGGGATVEACRFYISIDSTVSVNDILVVSYTTPDLAYVSVDNIIDGQVIEVAKNTIVVVHSSCNVANNFPLNGEAERCEQSGIYSTACVIHGDATMTVSKTGYGGQ